VSIQEQGGVLAACVHIPQTRTHTRTHTWQSRRSAGTAAPSSSTTMSPGTRSPESTIFCSPPLTTVHCGTDRDSRALMARSAFHSCKRWVVV
jgi:hypothetical protein